MLLSVDFFLYLPVSKVISYHSFASPYCLELEADFVSHESVADGHVNCRRKSIEYSSVC